MSAIVDGSYSAFQPHMVLEVLPKLMNTMVVDVMYGSLHGE